MSCGGSTGQYIYCRKKVQKSSNLSSDTAPVRPWATDSALLKKSPFLYLKSGIANDNFQVVKLSQLIFFFRASRKVGYFVSHSASKMIFLLPFQGKMPQLDVKLE